MKDHLSFFAYFRLALKNFIEAIGNLNVFLPYFFSVLEILKTLFSPWKHLVSKKTFRGFSFSDWFERTSFNLISRGMGFIIRIEFLFFYLIFHSILLLSTPLIFILYLLFIPIYYLIYITSPTEQQTKTQLAEKFVRTHMQLTENIKPVLSWFEIYYQKEIYRSYWWKLTRLMSYPPLGRDWAVGYTPTLDDYTLNLCSIEYQKNIKNVVDRQKEVELIEQTMSKSRGANVVIVGEEGVGKHTIVDAFAKKIYEGRTSSHLAYMRILKLNLEKILSRENDLKKKEEFLEELFDEAAEAGKTILFIDNFHRYIYSSEATIDLTSSFEKYAKSDRLQFVAVTTPFLFQKYIFLNDKINKLFQKIDVFEVGPADALQVLLQMTPDLERRNNIFISYEAVKESVDKSEYFITNIPFPEKAIELLDNASSYAVSLSLKVVTPKEVRMAIEQQTHIPTTLTPEIKQKLLKIESLLKDHIVQQTEALTKVTTALQRSFLLMGKRKKPLATFLFFGPTGVGKTETAKTIASLFFGSENDLIRFDMSLYQNTNDIEKLIGSADSGNPGLLTEKIREKPYGVLLLDEIEKANKDLINIFLTLIDEGYFTDGFGKRVDARNLVIIATSNAGVELMYSNEEVNHSDFINHLIQKGYFSPEFLNRFDGIVIFEPLTKASIEKLGKRMVESIAKNIDKMYKIKLVVSDEYLALLASKGYDKRFGARNMERTIREDLEGSVAKFMLTNGVKEGTILRL